MQAQPPPPYPSTRGREQDLTARVRALYENSAVPVREIARRAGVTERTIYKYAQKGGWKARYAWVDRGGVARRRRPAAARRGCAAQRSGRPLHSPRRHSRAAVSARPQGDRSARRHARDGRLCAGRDNRGAGAERTRPCCNGTKPSIDSLRTVRTDPRRARGVSTEAAAAAARAGRCKQTMRASKPEQARAHRVRLSGTSARRR